MKKGICIFVVFLLMISLFLSISFADEETTENQENTEQQEQVSEEQPQITEIKETVINTYGKIVETSGVKEVFNGKRFQRFL